MINCVVGMTRLAESQAGSAVMALMEEVRRQNEFCGEKLKSPIVFNGRLNRAGTKVPAMIIIDLHNCCTHVSLGFDQQWIAGNVPTVIAKRARRVSEILLRQYLKQQGRSKPIARPRALPQTLTIYHGTIQA